MKQKKNLITFYLSILILTITTFQTKAQQKLADSSFVENVKGVQFKMIKIPNRNYYAAQSEVTQELWEAITGETPSEYKNCPKCPVESVSYNDITQKFLPKLNQLTQKNYRLPFYKEWFFAALGGKKYKEAPLENINEISWNRDNSNLTPQIVMQKKPNGYGLYDVIGNVYEWTDGKREGYEKRVCYGLMGGDWADFQAFRMEENIMRLLPPDEEDEGSGLRLFLTEE